MYFSSKKIVIVGLGLIGGSIARALTAKKLCQNVVAVGRNETVLRQAKEQGVIADYGLHAGECGADADLVIIAVPGLAVEDVFRQLAGRVGTNVVITDAVSVKQSIIDAAAHVFGAVPRYFVPGHPIAGS